jgi:hypothetical protein
MPRLPTRMGAVKKEEDNTSSFLSDLQVALTTILYYPENL